MGYEKLNLTSPVEVELTPTGSWKQTSYLLDVESANALKMALAINRPLLVKGEPGLGKSYLALAAAKLLERAFFAEVINSHTEGQDLLWKDDPIQRLNDAQSKQKTGDELHPKHYINPGILWWAFGWDSADDQYNNNLHHKISKPNCLNKPDCSNGIVLLIDEIDKADPSLPNSLLEVLGNGGFDVPLVGVTVGQSPPSVDGEASAPPSPLVIITTNDERELPPAFVRRCLVLHLKVDEDNLEQWLIERVRVHVEKEECSDEILKEAAKQLKKDRADADQQGMIKAGLAEYIDLIEALVELTQTTPTDEREQAQRSLLKDIAKFSLCKAGV